MILLASVIIWLLNSFTFEGGFKYLADGVEGDSVLNAIGSVIAVIFAPLGFGNWQAAVATVLGLVAKEEVVGVFGSLTSMADADLAFEAVEAGNSAGLALIGQEVFGGCKLAAFSFMIFNLLCAPCFAAMGAIRREMNNAKWTAFAITYQCVFAYIASLIVYQIGAIFVSTATVNVFGVVVAVLALASIIFLLARPYKESTKLTKTVNVKK